MFNSSYPARGRKLGEGFHKEGVAVCSIPLTPQGDGNRWDRGRFRLGRPRSIPLTPQGDGNFAEAPILIATITFNSSYPARGRKRCSTVSAVADLDGSIPLTPQGDGNKQRGWRNNSIQQFNSSYPARGRKHSPAKIAETVDHRSIPLTPQGDGNQYQADQDLARA